MTTSPSQIELSSRARNTLRFLETALPRNEWEAVEAWLTMFYPFQLEWLLDWSKFALLNKSRQIGASHTYAAAAVLWAMFNESTTIVSVGETEAIEVLDKARSHAAVLRGLGSRWLRSYKDKEGFLSFSTHGRILALPSSGPRGYSGNVLLDEYGYHKNPDKVWDAAAGAVMHGGKESGRLRVMSTPNGVGNSWHELYTDPKEHEGYVLHEVTLPQAIDQGLRVDMDLCWKAARGDARLFDQLYNCKFLGGDLQYLPTEAVNDAALDNLYTYDGEYYGGLDIGRSADKTVLIVVRKDPDTSVRTVVRIVSAKRTDSDLLRKIVAEAFKKFRLKRLCVDETGMGSFPIDDMKKRHGRFRVEGVNFSLRVKEELATGLYSAFVEKTVRIPKTDMALPDLQAGAAVQLRQDLFAIRRETTAAGNVRYDAPQTAKGHADSAWALALALHASGGPNRRRHEVNLSGGPENLY